MSEDCCNVNVCVVGVGSNIDPENNIQAVLAILRRETVIVGVSSWVKTAPIGVTDQNDFINGAIKIQTLMSRESFKSYLKELENKLGRDRTLPKFGPRIIDLDIVVWNGEIVDDDYFTRDFLKNAIDELRQ